MISINGLISTTFLSGLLDDLLQFGQVRVRKLSVGGLQQRRQLLTHHHFLMLTLENVPAKDLRWRMQG